jgi:hypothetical protein
MRNTSAFQPKSASGLNAGLVSYWRFDESSGNASDSFASNTLTNSNVTYSAVKINNGAVFNGSSSNFSNAGTVIPMGAKTISFWFQSSASSGFHTVLGNQKWDSDGQFGTTVWVNGTSGILNFQFRRNTVVAGFGIDSTIDLCDGVLRLITCTWDGTTGVNGAKLYINASLDAQATSGGTETTTPSQSFKVGVLPGGTPNYYLNGNLDEVGIWNRALSATEVTELYNSTNGIQLPSQALTTKAYYPLNGNSNDYSGNLNTGTDTAITYPQGRFGQAAKFNGTSSLISVADTGNLLDFGTSDFTIGAWVYPTANDARFIFAKGTGGGNSQYWLRIEDTSTQLRFLTAEGAGETQVSADSSTALKLNSWSFVAAGRRGTTHFISINGRDVKQTVGTVRNCDNANTFNLGSRSGGGGEFFQGLIDEVIIESRAWTAKEVETYYRKSMLNYKQKTFGQMVWTYISELGTGVYALSGKNLTTLRNYVSQLLKGAYTLTGKQLTANKAYVAHLLKGVYNLVGKHLSVPRRWLNQTKPTSTFTSQTKPTSIWTDQTKD